MPLPVPVVEVVGGLWGCAGSFKMKDPVLGISGFIIYLKDVFMTLQFLTQHGEAIK